MIRPEGMSRRQLRDYLADLTQKVLVRDGPNCWYCNVETSLSNAETGWIPTSRTLEHLLPQAHGGNDALENLCIACRECNAAVRDDSIVKKVSRRERYRIAAVTAVLENENRKRIDQIEAQYSKSASARPLTPNALANIEAARIAAERRERERQFQAERDRRSERAFIDVAKECLDRELYQAIWTRVNSSNSGK